MSATTITPPQQRSLTAELIELLPGVALALIMCGAVVQSLAIAPWAPGLAALVPAALPALLVGAVFARTRWLPSWMAHPLSGVLAAAWVVQVLGPQMDERLLSWRDRASDLVIRTIILFRTVGSGGRGEDILLFVATLSLLLWILCYATAWMLFRKGWTWPAVLVNAAVILVNYTYVLPKPTNLFFVFLAAALTLLVYQNVLARQAQWAARRVEYPDFLPLRFVWTAGLVCTALVVATGVLPGNVTSAQASRTWDLIRQPFAAARERWEDVFSTITAAPGTGGGSFTARSVTLGGARVLSDEVVMYVRSTGFDYWRAVAFDRYTGQGWQNTTGEQARAALGVATPEQARTRVPADEELPLRETRARNSVVQTFEMADNRKDDFLMVGGMPLKLSREVLVEHNFADGQPNFDDLALLVSTENLRAGDVYTITALISRSDVQSLRAAGDSYPAWVRERYLQIPDGVTPRTIELARRIVEEAGARTPYDQTVAIQDYLRTFPYNENIPAPPGGRDLVDYFLFDMREGYCDYYASAMVVMLRSLGVPARLAQGYAGGDFDVERAAYVVRESVAHSWPEVYFPGFGWERFEPTPASYTSLPRRPLTATFGEERPEDLGPLASQPAPDPGRLEDLDEGLEAVPVPAPAGEAAAAAVDLRGPLSVMGGGLGLVGLVALAIYGRWRFERRGLPPAAAAYAGLGLVAGWAGLGQRPEATPAEYGAELARALPEHAEVVRQVAAAYESERYRPGARADAPDAEALKQLYLTLAKRTLARPFAGSDRERARAASR